MKAIRVHAFDAPPVLEDVADPVARVGRTVVRMEAATVGHIDRTVWRGSFLKNSNRFSANIRSLFTARRIESREAPRTRKT